MWKRNYKTIIVLLSIIISASLAKGENKSNNNINTPTYDVIIVGGGFSGLTAAYHLKRKNVLVLEKKEAIGGRCISGNWNNFHYPKGTEYIGKPESYMKKLFRKLNIQATQIPAPTDGVAYKGKFFFGEKILDYLSPEEQKQYTQLQRKLKELADEDIEDIIFDKQQRLSEYTALDNLSVKEWLNKNGYSSLIQKFIDVENRGLFGTDNANCSMLFNIPEMAFDLPLVESINKSEVYSFNHGMFSVAEALGKRLGNHLITGAEVLSVMVNKDNSISVTYTKNGKQYHANAKAAIMATPAPITGYLVKNHLSPEVKKILSEVSYSQYATINFFTKRRLLHQTWSVSCIDEGEVVTLYDATRPQVTKDYRGKSILSVYMAPEDAYNQSFVNQSDKQFIENAYQTLNKYYPDFNNEVIDYSITRFKYAFPIFSPKYVETIKILTNDSTLDGPIFLAGDYMVYATVDGALISAEVAAKKARSYLRMLNNQHFTIERK
ncbi:MAG: FAD-dependent oxidoreductase [Prolixibacteraceae bacterium]|jgi:protoporphyrinogen oxidase|nr:FAD-dependent oxidoreductase [Prolixibacteraceae bacterium]